MFTNILLYYLGEEAIANKHLTCANKNYLLVNNELGSLYLWFSSLCIIFYSFIILHIFYRLPKKFNLVSYQRLGQKKINTEVKNINITQSMVKQDENLSKFLTIHEEEDKFAEN